MKCHVCKLRIDPVAAPVHPCCEPTPDAAYIRSLSRSWRMKGFTGRIPKNATKT